MLIHVVPQHALTNYGAQGGAPPAPSFDAAGYNTSFYAWKSGGDGGGYWNGHRNRCYCNNYLRNGWGDSNVWAFGGGSWYWTQYPPRWG